MSQKYHGSIEVLENVVSVTGISGEWQVDRSGKHTFRSYDGGIFNWWPSSGTIQFQGKPEGKAILERALERLLAGSKGIAKPTRTAAECGLESRLGIIPVSRPEVTSLAAGRYCLDDTFLKRIKEALSASGNTIIHISDSLHVVRKAEFDHYRSLVER